MKVFPTNLTHRFTPLRDHDSRSPQGHDAAGRVYADHDPIMALDAQRNNKFRRAMVRPGRDRLSEMVEVDETFVGGEEPGGGRRHVGKKALVVIAAEVRGRAIARIRMRRVEDSSAESLLPFVQEVVEPDTPWALSKTRPLFLR